MMLIYAYWLHFALLRVKRAETFQGQEINFGKLLLVLRYEAPHFKIMGVIRPLLL